MKENKPFQNQFPNRTDLKEKIWAVVNVDGIVATDLDYDTAYTLLRAKQKEAKHDTGLALVTSAAAARMNKFMKVV